MEEKIILNDDDIKFLVSLLTLMNDKKVIKQANYFNKITGEFGNTCCDYQNWCYEKIGCCLVNDKRQLVGWLNDKNREDFNNRLKEWEAKNV